MVTRDWWTAPVQPGPVTNHESPVTVPWIAHGTESPHHWRTNGPRAEPPRRRHGHVSAARRRVAGGDQEAGAHGGRHRQPGSEAAGRDAGRRKAREVFAGDRRNVQGPRDHG